MSDSSILIIGPAWIGDMVMAQTLFKVLKQREPNTAIDVVAPTWSAPLLERMPEVNRMIPLPLGHGEFRLKIRRELGLQLRAQHYQQAIVLPNSWKSALVPLFSNISVRTGWRGEWRYALLNDVRVLDPARYPLMIQRFAALAYPKGQPLPTDLPRPKLQVNSQTVAQTLDKFSLHTHTKIVAMCPGAEYGGAKRWPASYFAEVAQAQLAEGAQIWIFGSAKEQSISDEIQQAIGGRAIDLAGKTTLAEAIDLLSVANAVVTNDSGLMHIAASLGIPLIVIYGSTDPGFTPPLSDEVKILRLSLECSPCFERECPLGHYNCLKQITPSQVNRALAESEYESVNH